MSRTRLSGGMCRRSTLGRLGLVGRSVSLIMSLSEYRVGSVRRDPPVLSLETVNPGFTLLDPTRTKGSTLFRVDDDPR